MNGKTLAPFAKQLGLDFIITSDGQVFLIELQPGFGRLGIMTLFPELYQKYRRYLRQKSCSVEPDHIFLKKYKRFCRNKILTYRLLKEFQPNSYLFRKWESPALKRWLHSLSGDFILAKPPLGARGEGIRLFKREQLLAQVDHINTPPTLKSVGLTSTLEDDRVSSDKKTGSISKINLGNAVLLQDYVFSRPIFLENQREKFIGCIRHVILLICDGRALDIYHLPSYWRVSPHPFSSGLNRESLTANISRGATPLEVDPGEADLVKTKVEEIIPQMVSRILSMPQPPPIKSSQFFSSLVD